MIFKYLINLVYKIMNNNYILILLYFINQTLYVLLFKILEYYLNINNILFNCFIYGLLFIILSNYCIFYNIEYKKIDLILGIIDYIQLLIIYISINNLTTGEYICYRTSSILFNILLSYVYLDYTITLKNKIGIIIIIISYIILIIFNYSSILYAAILLLGSFLYSLIGLLIEKFQVNTIRNNYIQIKWISGLLNFITYIIFIDNSDNIFKYNIYVWIIIILCIIFELGYYKLKIKIIKNIIDGSIFINFLDIIRRIFMLIIGLIIFKDKETYNISIYISFAFITIGSYLIVKKDKK